MRAERRQDDQQRNQRAERLGADDQRLVDDLDRQQALDDAPRSG
ncbi:MAG: hypothetical protein ABW167_02995 [Baekduia sp.]